MPPSSASDGLRGLTSFFMFLILFITNKMHLALQCVALTLCKQQAKRKQSRHAQMSSAYRFSHAKRSPNGSKIFIQKIIDHRKDVNINMLNWMTRSVHSLSNGLEPGSGAQRGKEKKRCNNPCHCNIHTFLIFI